LAHIPRRRHVRFVFAGARSRLAGQLDLGCYGSVRVQFNGAEADVSGDGVTNDRDWLKVYRSMHADDAAH
jgi:hypothetical protein